MHIIWWPSSLKRVAGSLAPVRAKTARQRSPHCRRRAVLVCLVIIFIRRCCPYGARFLILEWPGTSMPGFHIPSLRDYAGASISRRYRGWVLYEPCHGNADWGWSVWNQRQHCAAKDDPDTQPDPHHERVEVCFENRAAAVLIQALIH